jgi:hypothetical protein
MTLALVFVLGAAVCLLVLSVLMAVWLARRDPRDLDLPDYW